MNTSAIEIQGNPVRPSARSAIPAVLADVALIDGPTCAAACGMSLSQWHTLVKGEGEDAPKAPKPVIRESRFTRWRLADVRAYLIKRVEKAATNTTKSEAVVERARKASHTARDRAQSAKVLKPGTSAAAATAKRWREAQQAKGQTTTAV